MFPWRVTFFCLWKPNVQCLPSVGTTWGSHPLDTHTCTYYSSWHCLCSQCLQGQWSGFVLYTLSDVQRTFTQSKKQSKFFLSLMYFIAFATLVLRTLEYTYTIISWLCVHACNKVRHVRRQAVHGKIIEWQGLLWSSNRDLDTHD